MKLELTFLLSFRYCQVYHEDDHDTHGLHALRDYDLDAFNLRDLAFDQGHGQGSGHGHAHVFDVSHNHDHGHGTSHSRLHSHESSHSHDGSDEADNSQEAGRQPSRSPVQAAPGRGLALIPGREPISTVPVNPADPWMYAKCDLKPNVDVPESAVRGNITISQLVRKQVLFFVLLDCLFVCTVENYKNYY